MPEVKILYQNVVRSCSSLWNYLVHRQMNRLFSL